MSLADRILKTESIFNRHQLLAEKYMGFDKLKRSLAHKKHGKPFNPGAVAAKIGREKYGKSKFQAMAAKGRKAACYDESVKAVSEIAALSESLAVLRDTIVQNIKK